MTVAWTARGAGSNRPRPRTQNETEPETPDGEVLRIGGTLRFPRERLLKWLRDREQGRPEPRKKKKRNNRSAS